MRALLCLVLLVAAAIPAAAKPKPFVTLALEATEIYAGETVVLEIESTGLLDPVDLTPLDAIGARGRETIGTRIAVIDGQVVEIALRRIELTPRGVGPIVIGPLASDAVVSNAVVVHVLAERPGAWTPDGEDIRIEQAASVTTPWLQQEIVLDIRVVHRHTIFNDQMALPDFSGFRAVEVFAERRTLEQADGGRAVMAWRFLLYPERSGTLTIPPARFTGTIARSRVERAEVELASAPVTVAVRPSAFDAGQWWLAARDVRMTDAWTVEPTALRAGDETERTITVEAEGVLAEQIPDIAMGETRGFQITPLGEERSSVSGESGSSARASFRFKVRAQSPVSVFLDTVRLRWWDVDEDRAVDAIIPARRVEIGMPDRDKLLEAAGGRWIDALPTIPAMWALAVGGVALVAGLAGLARRREPDPFLDMARLAMARARAGDPAGLHEAVRRLARIHGAGAEVRALRDRIESRLFGDDPATPVAPAETIATLRRAIRDRARQARARTLLPEL